MREYITYRQSIFLMSLILPVTGHFLLLNPIIRTSGVSAWTAILLSLPFGIGFAVILYRLHRFYPSYTIIQMIEQAWGKWIGKAITVTVLLYFGYMMVITFYAFSDYVQVVFLPETPLWAIGILFYMVVWYAIYVGTETITRISEPLFLFIMLSGIAIGLSSLPYKDYHVLLPLFPDGLRPVLYGIPMTLSLFGEMSILLMLKLKKDHDRSKSLLVTNIMLSILITIMFVGTTTSVLSIFGEIQGSNLDYPAQSVLRLVKFPMMERFDMYGVTIMTFASTIRMSIFHIATQTAFEQWKGPIKRKWLFQSTLSAAIIIVSFTAIPNIIQFMDLVVRRMYPWTGFVSVGFPTLTWLILEIKHLNQRGKTTQLA